MKLNQSCPTSESKGGVLLGAEPAQQSILHLNFCFSPDFDKNSQHLWDPFAEEDLKGLFLLTSHARFQASFGLQYFFVVA